MKLTKILLSLFLSASSFAGDLYFICAELTKDGEETFVVDASLDDRSIIFNRFTIAEDPTHVYRVIYNHKKRHLRVRAIDLNSHKATSKWDTKLEINRPFVITETLSCKVSD